VQGLFSPALRVSLLKVAIRAREAGNLNEKHDPARRRHFKFRVTQIEKKPIWFFFRNSLVGFLEAETQSRKWSELNLSTLVKWSRSCSSNMSKHQMVLCSIR
jgi:hypothetical protein